MMFVDATAVSRRLGNYGNIGRIRISRNSAEAKCSWTLVHGGLFMTSRGWTPISKLSLVNTNVSSF